MNEQNMALVWCPFPDAEAAQGVAKVLLTEKRIACANIFPAVQSIFEWQGTISSSEEVCVLFKTASSELEALVVRLGECHPYDTPSIAGWRCDATHPATLQWMDEALGNG